MAQCKWCDASGWFLGIDSNGLCRECQPMFVEAINRCRVLKESVELAQEGKTVKTRVSRCDLAIEHAEYLLPFEEKGINTVDPTPTKILKHLRSLRTEIVVTEASLLADKAIAKSKIATTARSKENAVAAGLLKIREFAGGYGLSEDPAISSLEDTLRSEIHRVTLSNFEEAAQKAEFKGNTKKAIDQYQEALFFLLNDDVDDSQQQAEIARIEGKIEELKSG